jgi:hypothetical protein
MTRWWQSRRSRPGWGVEESTQHVHDPLVDFGRLWILKTVNKVLSKVLQDYFISLRFHPRGGKTPQVKGGITVKVQFVMQQLVGRLRGHPLFGYFILGDAFNEIPGAVSWCNILA